jgi:hypothetical protein
MSFFRFRPHKVKIWPAIPAVASLALYSSHQQQLKQIHKDLFRTKARMCGYRIGSLGPRSFNPFEVHTGELSAKDNGPKMNE